MSEPNLLLLHGALGASSQFAQLIPLLDDDFELHTLDFEGHGGREFASGSSEISSMPRRPFSMSPQADSPSTVRRERAIGVTIG